MEATEIQIPVSGLKQLNLVLKAERLLEEAGLNFYAFTEGRPYDANGFRVWRMNDCYKPHGFAHRTRVANSKLNKPCPKV